ncbi:hypothetical protein ACIOJE_34390 [Kitasatospora sp. NPDC087861]|uniref:hypothetical protein n=1 Tax=Kitasatospora sp. NPDC087861 TaxID=3364070 RepID=UPI00381CFD1D
MEEDLRDRIRDLKEEVVRVRAARTEEVAELRTRVNTLAQQVQALTLDNTALRARDPGPAAVGRLPRLAPRPAPSATRPAPPPKP